MNTAQEVRPTPGVAGFAVIQIFWMTEYSTAIFQVLGGIIGQGILLAVWLFLLLIAPRTGSGPAIRNLGKHRFELLCLTVFLVINLLNMMFDRGGYTYVVKILLVLITYASVVVHISGDFRRYRQAAIVVTVIMGAIAIYDLPTIILNPFIGRYHEFAPGEIRWFGTWGFFMTYATAIGACLALMRTARGALKYALLALCIAMIALIVASTFAASIILMLLSLGGFVAFAIRRPRTYIILGLVAAGVVVAVSQFDLSAIPQIESMNRKIATIFTIGTAAEISDPNDPRVRASLAENSIRSFEAHPLIGVGMIEGEKGDRLIGTHSSFIDNFARYGVLGFTWYLLFFGLRFGRLIEAIRHSPSNIIYQGRLITASAFAIGALANPSLFDTGISAVVFILAFAPIGLGAPKSSGVERRAAA